MSSASNGLFTAVEVAAMSDDELDWALDTAENMTTRMYNSAITQAISGTSSLCGALLEIALDGYTSSKKTCEAEIVRREQARI